MHITRWLAPGTPYELPTVNALISLAEDQTLTVLFPPTRAALLSAGCSA